MKYVGVALVVVAVRLCAVAQLQSGTIVVISSPEDEIVVASDSRTTDRTSYDDHRCKITALGNKLIFAAAGYTGEGPLGGPPIWDFQTLARQQFRLLRRRNKTAIDNLPLATAKVWGKAAKIKMLDTVRRKGTPAFFASLDGNIIASAVFAGFDARGNLSIVSAILTYEMAHNQVTVNFSITSVITTPGGQQFVGDYQVAKEISVAPDGSPLRNEIDADIRANNPQDPVAFSSIEIVKLSIEHDRRTITKEKVASLGGRIDAVGVWRSGGIRWIQRTESCPEN